MPFKKLELAAEMVRAWKSCLVPLQPDFFTPARMTDWKTHLRLRKQLKDNRCEDKQTSPPKLDKKILFVEWIHRLKLWSMNNVSLKDCGLYWYICDEAVPIDVANGKPVPNLVPDRCHLEGCISVDDMLMKYSSHDNPVFTKDKNLLKNFF